MAVCSLLFAVCFLLAACALPGDAAPVVKIGVIAPFEGAGRPLGYAVLPAVKAAVAEANASGKLGRYQVMVVAFNDDLHGPTAAAQAQALALDPEVLGVVGPWTAETAAPRSRSWPQRACLARRDRHSRPAAGREVGGRGPDRCNDARRE